MCKHLLLKRLLWPITLFAACWLVSASCAAADSPHGWVGYQCEANGKVVARSNMPLPGCTASARFKTAKSANAHGKSATQAVSFNKAGQVEILLTEYRKEREQLQKLESAHAGPGSPSRSGAQEEEQQRVRADLKALRNELARLGVPDPDQGSASTAQRAPL